MEVVHTGSWTNWSYGRVQGATLTLSNRNAAYLIAFLALFVRLSGSNFWDLMCYAIFQARATERPRDGLHHQQQAILRNRFNDVNAGLQFSRLAWAWRDRADKVLWRSLPLIFSAFFHVVTFAAAGIFSSKVAFDSHEILLRSQLCGNWPVPGTSGGVSLSSPATVIAAADWESKINQNRYASSAFANACYNNSVDQKSPNSVNCNPFGPKRLDWTVMTNTSCPFKDEICVGDSFVRFDTGLINSHFDLGINAPPKDRVEYRQVLECAPLKTDPFATFTTNRSEIQITSNFHTFENEEFIKFDYGRNYVMNTSYTFVANNDTFSTWIGNSNIPPYMLDVEISVLKNPDEGTFAPIDALERTDADIFLVFLVNGMQYIEPVDDPWFLAQTPHVIPVPGSDGSFTNVTLYSSKTPVSLLGCAQQQQWCNPHRSGGRVCTELTGSVVDSRQISMETASKNISLSPRQRAILERIYYGMWVSQVVQIIIGMDSSVMLAGQYSGGDGLGPKLPGDQWIKELNYWFGTFLTGLQLETLHYVTGDGDPSHDKYIRKPTSADESWMCSSQVVQRGDFTSFSILGITLILVLGGLIIFVNIILIRTVDSFRHTPLGEKTEWRNAQWRAADLLQLQKIAFQAYGMGTWKNSVNSVPVTAPGEKLGTPLPIRDVDEVSLTTFDEQASASPWKRHKYLVKTSSQESEGLSFQNSIPTTSSRLDVEIPHGSFQEAETTALIRTL